jgi:hypothetical protein
MECELSQRRCSDCGSFQEFRNNFFFRWQGEGSMAVVAKGSMQQLFQDCIANSQSRLDLWLEFIQRTQIERMVEIGVYQGDFAAAVLQHCENVTKYYMVDPWRHLDDWNKPSNENNEVFEHFFQTTKAKTDFAAARRVILRGKTTDVVDEIADGELDFAYIDGDHTLKGIAIDLIRIYPKVKLDGFVGGDDFTPTMWQHKASFEPTLVFPFVIYFAEAVGATIYALPNLQFCLQKTEYSKFSFIDLTGRYNEMGLRTQLAPERLLKLWFGERFPWLAWIASAAKKMVP